MPAGDIKIMWVNEKDGVWGTLLPMFLIYKSGKQLYLDIMESGHKPGCENRHVEIDSVHQGKCIAAEILKITLEENSRRQGKQKKAGT